MKQKYREIRKIRTERLRELCISKGWYTRGTTEEYHHLLADLAGSRENITAEDIVEIAENILEHSETDQELAGICSDIAKAADVFFEKVQQMQA